MSQFGRLSSVVQDEENYVAYRFRHNARVNATVEERIRDPEVGFVSVAVHFLVSSPAMSPSCDDKGMTSKSYHLQHNRIIASQHPCRK